MPFPQTCRAPVAINQRAGTRAQELCLWRGHLPAEAHSALLPTAPAGTRSVSMATGGDSAAAIVQVSPTPTSSRVPPKRPGRPPAFLGCQVCGADVSGSRSFHRVSGRGQHTAPAACLSSRRSSTGAAAHRPDTPACPRMPGLKNWSCCCPSLPCTWHEEHEWD